MQIVPVTFHFLISPPYKRAFISQPVQGEAKSSLNSWMPSKCVIHMQFIQYTRTEKLSKSEIALCRVGFLKNAVSLSVILFKRIYLLDGYMEQEWKKSPGFEEHCLSAYNYALGNGKVSRSAGRLAERPLVKNLCPRWNNFLYKSLRQHLGASLMPPQLCADMRERKVRSAQYQCSSLADWISLDSDF